MDLHSIDINNMDMKVFMDLIDSSEGNVYLITDDGNKLNLKSKLSQLVGLINIVEGASVSEASLAFDNPDDETRFFRTNLYGEEA
ncbi:hypothetical protein [Fastidiosipila sanguinis]|uniref:Polya polymerase n=1 Tax=Fastidiosipila sanguinis TaxID=236753 RepID=A0A2S0KM11_9FIRM|nr:hypothetical protein [Fastidiosipila sanguinis]AVM42073.1 hypothetical protein C5Q98_01970 [Fastidiosipila sanguinis]